MIRVGNLCFVRPVLMDLAEGHVIALAALENDETFSTTTSAAGSGFGGSGGKYKAYNLGKDQGISGACD